MNEMPNTCLDHIVVAASSLEMGQRWAKQVLGVTPVTGGRHAGRGTHNCLLSLGEHSYLEIIAIDPEAEAPTQPRWFGLDTAQVRALIADEPRLIAWVAQVSGPAGSIQSLVAAPGYAANRVNAASRANLRWQFADTPDGERIQGGTLPHLIEWADGAHPTQNLPDSGLRLSALLLGTPEPEPTQTLLSALHFSDARVQVGQSATPQLVAYVQTAHGPVILD